MITSDLQCPQCQQIFTPRTEWQKFCSTKCRMLDASARRRAGIELLKAQDAAPKNPETPPEKLDEPGE